MTRQMYAWVGDDGGWKIGRVAIHDVGGNWMQRYHEPHIIEWVATAWMVEYPATPIEKATP